MQAMRLAAARGETILPQEAPGPGELIRAFRQKGLELRFLVNKEGKPHEMTTHAEALRDQALSSRTLDEGYVDFLINLYLSFHGAERDLIRVSPKGGVWEWMERYPTRSWLFRVLVLALIAPLFYAIFKQIFIPPG